MFRSSQRFWTRLKGVLLALYGVLIRVRVICASGTSAFRQNGKGHRAVPLGASSRSAFGQLRTGFIVAANHLTGADSVVIQIALKTRIFFLAAARWFHTRFVGFWMRNLCDTMPVANGVGGENIATLRRSLDMLKQGAVIGVYPEGELNRSGEVRRVFDGAAWLAIRAGAPVLPVYVTGLKLGPEPFSRPWIDEAWEGFFSVVGNLLNRRIVVAIGEPILPPAEPPADYAGMKREIERINRHLLIEFSRLRSVSVDRRTN